MASDDPSLARSDRYPSTGLSADPISALTITPETLDLGLDYDAYRAGCVRNLELFDEVYAHPTHTAEDLQILARLPPLQLIAIVEDWCPDVCHTLPTWVRIVEQLPGWSYRIFRRDEHPDLMDNFLQADGARALPVYAFLNQHNSVLGWWSGRGSEAQEEVDRLLDGRRFIDLSPADRQAIGETFERRYRETFRRSNFLEVLTLLRTFHQR